MAQNNYQELLALSYFKQVGGEYSLINLMALLGLNHDQLDELLEKLNNKKLLVYSNFLLSITEEGLLNLIYNDIDYTFFEDEYLLEQSEKVEALPIDSPYLPKNFLKKV